VKTYLPEILKYVSKAMESQSWLLKKQAGLTLKETADNVGDALNAHLDLVLKMIVSNLPGRLWKGKDSLLAALSSVCNACTAEIMKGGPGRETPQSLVEIALKETKKNDREYKRQAVSTISSILNVFTSKNVDLYEIVKAQLFAIANGDDVGTDEGEMKDKPLVLLIRAGAFQAIANAWPSNYETQSKDIKEYVDLLCQQYPKNVWNIRVEILNSLKSFLQKAYIQGDKPPLLSKQMAKDILAVCFDAMSDNKYSMLRTAGLEVLEVLITQTEGTDLLETVLSDINNQLTLLANNDGTMKDKTEKIKFQLVDHPSKKRKTP